MFIEKFKKSGIIVLICLFSVAAVFTSCGEEEDPEPGYLTVNVTYNIAGSATHKMYLALWDSKDGIKDSIDNTGEPDIMSEGETLNNDSGTVIFRSDTEIDGSGYIGAFINMDDDADIEIVSGDPAELYNDVLFSDPEYLDAAKVEIDGDTTVNMTLDKLRP